MLWEATLTMGSPLWRERIQKIKRTVWDGRLGKGSPTPRSDQMAQPPPQFIIIPQKSYTREPPQDEPFR